jgi:hypothetical protein
MFVMIITDAGTTYVVTCSSGTPAFIDMRWLTMRTSFSVHCSTVPSATTDIEIAGNKSTSF